MRHQMLPRLPCRVLGCAGPTCAIHHVSVSCEFVARDTDAFKPCPIGDSLGLTKRGYPGGTLAGHWRDTATKKPDSDQHKTEHSLTRKVAPQLHCSVLHCVVLFERGES